MLALSSYPKFFNSQVDIITACNSSDIWKCCAVTEIKFTSRVTRKTYFVKGHLSRNSKNVIYSITSNKWKDESIGSAVDFKPHFRT